MIWPQSYVRMGTRFDDRNVVIMPRTVTLELKNML